MAQISYDYHALKDARAKAGAAVEALESQIKVVKESGTVVASTNNAKGIQDTVTALEAKLDAVKKVIAENEEVLDKGLANTRELHVQNGGEE